MTGRLIQVVGTSSGAGKTTMVLALCRHFNNRGLKVTPFKAVNMSLNSISLRDGSEISRAQWLQALGARIYPKREINPILLKPQGDGSQVISEGRSVGKMTIDEYYGWMKSKGRDVVLKSLNYLLENYDLVVAEGAGSPAEINMEDRDLANTFIARQGKFPVIIIGDIDRGGVFASLYGTYSLMPDRDLVKLFIINRMRGKFSLLNPGIEKLERLTGVRTAGVIPYIGNINLPGEDSLDYPSLRSSGARVAVIRYPYMENYSDLDLLIMSGNITYVDKSNAEVIDESNLIILPGSKIVGLDLDYIIDSGIAARISSALARGARVLGICGGYQMLGKTISDPNGVQMGSTRNGLGLLDIEVIYREEKTTREVTYRVSHDIIPEGKVRNGYEIHYGVISRNGEKPLLLTELGDEGSVSPDGKVMGTNVHGILENVEFLRYLIGPMDLKVSYEELIDSNIERMTNIFIDNMDIREIEKLAGMCDLN